MKRLLFLFFFLAFLLPLPLGAYEVDELHENAVLVPGFYDSDPEAIGPFPVLEWIDAYYASGDTGRWSTTGSVGGTTGSGSQLWLLQVGGSATTRTQVAADVVVVSFTGDANDGWMELFIDGERYARVNGYSNPGENWAIGVMGLSEGRHTILIKATGLNDGQCCGHVAIRGAASAGAPIPIPESVDPESGPTSGGTPITIEGIGFLPGATVLVGALPARDVVVEDFYTITAVTPPAIQAGVYDITVTNPEGESGTLPEAYTYEQEGCGTASVTGESGSPVLLLLLLSFLPLLLPSCRFPAAFRPRQERGRERAESEEASRP